MEETRQQKIQRLREKLTKTLDNEAKKSEVAVSNQRIPRYDDVYWQGLEWLNSL